MGDKIYVVETISDGSEGFPYDEILSIGVCAVDLDAGDFESVYDAYIQVEPKYVGKPKLDYAEKQGLEVAQLYNGTPLELVAKDFRAIVKDKFVTSYDIRQEFTKYLTNDPWDITFESHIMPSISSRQPISLRCKYPEEEPEIIRKADVVWIQTNAIAHKSFYGIIDLCRRYNKKVRYFKYASAAKCAEQVVEDESAG